MQYDEFIAHLRRNSDISTREEADTAARIVLATLGQRLAGNEPRDLASQLPPELQEPLLQHVGPAEVPDDVDDFLRRVADREGPGTSPDQALGHTRAVLTTIASFVSQGEIEDLRAQLPAGYAPLFN
ncbi:DUF2267 domain-containing protein [Allosalinactinospora lopnorensis]|uniref:DUF2267 domain-containing protein n=1 Tax=Allosalinactinospora lopnorensis TaxID=1352348 RepID=UPI000623E97A|nr:DUF2267 domain-containing protein [Allosalinactinospora lopnorensis]